MLPNGASDWDRRGHSHHRSSVALHAGAGDDPVAEPVRVWPGAVARADSRRAACAVGLKLVRMGRQVQG